MIDTAVLGLIQRLLLEPDDGGRSWPSGLWDREDVLAAFNDAQMQFVRQTGILRGWMQVAYPANSEIVALPSGIQEILHADVFQEGRWRPCPPGTRREVDALLDRTPGWPLVCCHEEPGTAQLLLAPQPRVGGELHLLVLTAPQRSTGSGDPVSVGDLWIPFLIAGTLARMFSKPGVVFNPTRRDRYQAVADLGVQLALRRLRP